MKTKIIVVAGARPNFVKIAPIVKALKLNAKYQTKILHTGQHYDETMSHSFFKELGIPKPDFNLEAGKNNLLKNKTAVILERIEPILIQESPDMVLVVGDVDSTLAASIATKKLKIKLIHYEAGIRSWDRTMPEEINRLVTDSISDIFLTTSREASNQLILEGHSENKIHFVGNIMIETLINNLEIAQKIDLQNKFKHLNSSYVLTTFHRPSNVDDLSNLTKILKSLGESFQEQVVLCAHPRIIERCKNIVKELNSDILILDAQPYHTFLKLVMNSVAVVTDSGGLSEETTYLKIPCFTLRDNTERPETVSIGTNILLGSDINNLKNYPLSRINKKTSIPENWDSKVSQRIIEALDKV